MTHAAPRTSRLVPSVASEMSLKASSASSSLLTEVGRRAGGQKNLLAKMLNVLAREATANEPSRFCSSPGHPPPANPRYCIALLNVPPDGCSNLPTACSNWAC